jgi:hypothetical protein
LATLGTDTRRNVLAAKTPTRLIWLICITVLVMRVGAAHVHLCLDGREPARLAALTADSDDRLVASYEIRWNSMIQLVSHVVPASAE